MLAMIGGIIPLTRLQSDWRLLGSRWLMERAGGNPFTRGLPWPARQGSRPLCPGRVAVTAVTGPMTLQEYWGN